MPSQRIVLKLVALTSIVAIALSGYAFWTTEPKPEAGAPVSMTKQDETPQIPERPTPIFPQAVDSSIKFEDCSNDCLYEGNAHRTFEIPLPGGEKNYLSAIYLDEPNWKNDANDDQTLITRISDVDAAFSHTVSLDMPTFGQWKQIRVHIGDFAQDYCGDVSAVYSFRNEKIFAVAHIGVEDIGLAASQCPLKPEDYVANISKYEKTDAPDGFSAFCAVRKNCLKSYYEKPENREHLSRVWLKAVASVELR